MRSRGKARKKMHSVDGSGTSTNNERGKTDKGSRKREEKRAQFERAAL
jgi:hypothetical protein